jgi:hypothetical protein
MKRWLVLVVLLWLVPPAAAQVVAPWTVWMYSIDGYMNEFTPIGEVVRVWKLPGMERFQLIPQDLFVSPSGKWIIYSGRSESTLPYTVIVHDTETGGVRHQFTLNPSADLGGGPPELFSAMYDEANERAALGYFSGFYGAEPSNNDNWEIGILNLETGRLDAVLTAPPEIAQSFAGEHYYSIPVIQRFTDGIVEFAVIAGATENFPDAPTYAWNITTGDVKPIDHYTSLIADTWPATGEMIFPAQDERFGPLQQCAEPGSAHMAFNVVEVYDPVSGTRFPFYAQSDYAPRWAVFVQNGQRILIEECSLTEPHSRMILLERDGSVVNHFEGQPMIYRPVGTPDGFVYLSFLDATLRGTSHQTSLSVLMSINMNLYDYIAQNLLWQGTHDAYVLRLVHVHSFVPPPDSYPSWQHLMP